MNLLLSKVQRRLMIRPTGIDHHAVDGAALLDDPVDRRRHRRLLGRVRPDGPELAGVSLLRGEEVVARVREVERVHHPRAVVQAGLRDAEADAAVCSGDEDDW